MTQDSSTKDKKADPRQRKPVSPKREDDGQPPLSQRREEYESIGDGCYRRTPARPHE